MNVKYMNVMQVLEQFIIYFILSFISFLLYECYAGIGTVYHLYNIIMYIISAI